jgi:putative sigma-54 modulation protein
MKSRIQAINFDATEELEAYVEKKISKFEKLIDGILNVDVYLKLVKPKISADKEAGIKVSIPNVDFFSSKACETLRKLSTVVDAIEKQIKKHKEKISKK